MARASARWAKLLAAVMVVVVLLAGCGGATGGDNGGEALAPGVSLSRDEFIERADAACRKARRGLKEEVSRFLAPQRGEKPRSVLYGDLARLVLLPAIEAEMEAIRVLGVPPGERSRIDEILDEGEFTINRLVYEERIPSVDAVYRKFSPVSRMFRAYGLPGCVNGSGLTGGA